MKRKFIYVLLGLFTAFSLMIRAENDVVVLGGVLNNDSTMNPWTQARVAKAHEFYLSSPIRQILLSGKGPKPKTEAQVMQERLLSLGVSKNILQKEENSMSTIENAIFTFKKYTQGVFPEKIYLVSNKFHMERALAWFRLVFAKTTTEIVPLSAVDAGFTQAELGERVNMEKIYVKCFNQIVLPAIPGGDIEKITLFSTGKTLLSQKMLSCRKSLASENAEK